LESLPGGNELERENVDGRAVADVNVGVGRRRAAEERLEKETRIPILGGIVQNQPGVFRAKRLNCVDGIQENRLVVADELGEPLDVNGVAARGDRQALLHDPLLAAASNARAGGKGALDELVGA
jgi:hypothetical protein